MSDSNTLEIDVDHLLGVIRLHFLADLSQSWKDLSEFLHSLFRDKDPNKVGESIHLQVPCPDALP